jgi:HSP20 family protein
MSQQIVRRKKRFVETVLVTTGEAMSERTDEVYDAIARRAFEIFESNGRVLGCDLDDWFRAESELLYPVCLDLSESDDALVVRGALPGFKAEDIEVTVEPRRLTIAGKRETQERPATKELVSAERSGAWLLRTVDLPVEVNTGRVMGRFKDGILELTLPEAPAKTAGVVQAKAA